MTEQSTSPERDLGRVEGKLDLILQHFTDFAKEHRDNHQRVSDKHEALAARVTKVEGRISMFAVAGVVGVLAYLGDAKGVLITLLSKMAL